MRKRELDKKTATTVEKEWTLTSTLPKLYAGSFPLPLKFKGL